MMSNLARCQLVIKKIKRILAVKKAANVNKIVSTLKKKTVRLLIKNKRLKIKKKSSKATNSLQRKQKNKRW